MEIKNSIEILRSIIHEPVPKAAVGAQRENEAVYMAISALEKQVPKKPKDGKCINCKSERIEVWQDGGNCATKFPYCPDCGQKIDWSGD